MFTDAQLRANVTAAYHKIGDIGLVKDTMAEFGAIRVTDVPPERRVQFVRRLKLVTLAHAMTRPIPGASPAHMRRMELARQRFMAGRASDIS